MGRYLAAGALLRCPICGGFDFGESEAQLNTAGMTFLKLDWLNRSAATYECHGCGNLLWFNHNLPKDRG